MTPVSLEGAECDWRSLPRPGVRNRDVCLREENNKAGGSQRVDTPNLLPRVAGEVGGLVCAKYVNTADNSSLL